ncbi:MAG: T9SS type A sorting domain-containing protein, partial [Fibrobacter sp.]|nr:T9SS type A sorting domain-containing protein [Fibrobacter sp.]
LANGEFVMGDMNTYGVVYMSTAGRGIAARVPSDWNMGSSSSEGNTKIAPSAKVIASASVTYANGNLELRLNATVARVSVFDMRGKKISSRYYSSSASVPLKELVRAKGSYFVRVDNGKKVLFANRVIVTR